MGISDSLHNTSKTDCNNVKDAKTQFANQIIDFIKFDSLDENSDELKAKLESKITAKLEAGKPLTPKEMEYLKRNNPVLYAKALRIQLVIKQLEEQLKHAKSKEEVSNIETFAVAGISKNDPDKKYIIAAINRLMKDFRDSKTYKSLPPTSDEKNRVGTNEFKSKDDEEEEDDVDFAVFYSLESCGYQIGYSDTASNSFSMQS